MKRTLYKRATLWELSIPLRAPVRGIWRYATFEEAWGHLWRTGYPPGLPSEIKVAVRHVEPSRLGVDYLADVDHAVHDAFDSTDDLLAARISVPHPIAAEPSEDRRDSPEPLRFPAASLSIPASPKPLVLDSEALISDASALLPWNELTPQSSRWKARAIAVGLASGLTILLILFWPFSHPGPVLSKTTEQRSAVQPAVGDSGLPNAATTVAKPAEVSVPDPASAPGMSHALLQANDRSWITACADGKVVFSRLFTAGNKGSVDFMNRAVVRVGDAGPVEITLDGKPVGSLGQVGQVRVIELVRAAHFLVGGEAADCTLAKSR